jgi:hypothetical protein
MLCKVTAQASLVLNISSEYFTMSNCVKHLYKRRTLHGIWRYAEAYCFKKYRNYRNPIGICFYSVRLLEYEPLAHCGPQQRIDRSAVW